MTTHRKVTIGSRASPLSVAQTEEVLSHLRPHFPDVDFDVVPISTGGDRRKDAPLVSLGRGTFVKEIELALLNGEIDLAIHSAKALPAPLPEGLALAGTVPRRDPRDALVDRWELPLEELPSRAVVLQPRSCRVEDFSRRLRLSPAAVVGRIHRERLWLDMRTVRDDEVDAVVAALVGAVEEAR